MELQGSFNKFYPTNPTSALKYLNKVNFRKAKRSFGFRCLHNKILGKNLFLQENFVGQTDKLFAIYRKFTRSQHKPKRQKKLFGSFSRKRTIQTKLTNKTEV